MEKEKEERKGKVGKIVSSKLLKSKGKIGKIVSSEVLKGRKEEWQ